MARATGAGHHTDGRVSWSINAESLRRSSTTSPWAIYFRVSEAGIAHVTHHQLAKDCCISKPVVTAGITVLQRLGVIQVRRTNRREAAFIEMNIGGLSWSAIRRRARLFHQNRVSQKQQPRLPFAAASGNRGLPLSGNRELPPKGYVQGLVSDQSAVADRESRARVRREPAAAILSPS